jgi:hypothetical protein
MYITDLKKKSKEFAWNENVFFYQSSNDWLKKPSAIVIILLSREKPHKNKFSANNQS